MRCTGLLVLKPKTWNLSMLRSHVNQQLKYSTLEPFWEPHVLSGATVV